MSNSLLLFAICHSQLAIPLPSFLSCRSPRQARNSNISKDLYGRADFVNAIPEKAPPDKAGGREGRKRVDLPGFPGLQEKRCYADGSCKEGSLEVDLKQTI